ncbi:trehalose 6-phosphate phosphatase [Burkholderiaceae bacterium]|nr:trehalose 6-phosphate phosphatase [Burkholderiaceae bacterium]
MRHLFTEDGEKAIESVMRQHPLLAFDFDGTLAPIVARPHDAKVPDIVCRGLVQLAQRLPVAVITGRSVADVKPRLGFHPHYVIGNHGAEDPAVGPPSTASQALDSLRHRIVSHADALKRAGVEVEDKLYSLALHYRLAPDAGQALLCIEELLQGTEPALKRFGGKCVVNIVATGVPDKGDALALLLQRCGAAAAVFVGDDVNDEAVFMRAEPHWLTVKIGREDPLSRAMFFLDSDAELALMLQKMLALDGAI